MKFKMAAAAILDFKSKCHLIIKFMSDMESWAQNYINYMYYINLCVK